MTQIPTIQHYLRENSVPSAAPNKTTHNKTKQNKTKQNKITNNKHATKDHKTTYNIQHTTTRKNTTKHKIRQNNTITTLNKPNIILNSTKISKTK